MTTFTKFQPVFSAYLADPFVWKHEDAFYAIGTGDAEADGRLRADGRVIPLLRSHDLRHWEFVHYALFHPDPQLGHQFWAPAVAENDRRFYLSYSVGDCTSGKDHQLRVAVAERPEGPYQDVGKPLLLPGNEQFVFDPHPFRDDDGQWYLFYNRNYLEVEDSGRAGDAIVARRLETMTSLGQEHYPILRPSFDWQRGHFRNYNGQIIDWHTTEGACVVKRQGRYYCFYSGSDWATEKYGVDYAVSDSVLGPYRSHEFGEGPRILQAIPGQLRGPGHNSLVTDLDSYTDYIIFHAWDAAMKKRQMYIEKLIWAEDGPQLRRSVGAQSTAFARHGHQ